MGAAIMSANRTRLKSLFSRIDTLPDLSGSALALICAIDSGEMSIAALERIIANDPSLCEAFLKVASLQRPSSGNRSEHLRAALLYLGFSTIRSLAVSLALQIVVCGVTSNSGLTPDRIRVNGGFVGNLARSLFIRAQELKPVEGCWSADEVFALGVTHAVGFAILAHVAPELFTATMEYGRAAAITPQAAFWRLEGEHLATYASRALRTWGLPETFVLAQKHLPDPYGAMGNASCIACVAWAIEAAERCGYGLIDWDIKNASHLDLTQIGIEAEEAERILGEALLKVPAAA